MKEKSLAISSLGVFNSLVTDYLAEDENIRKLYSYSPTVSGLLNALTDKSKSYNQRALLKKIIAYNYPDLESIPNKLKTHIDLLSDNGYAITTAHQPALFLGPQYIITKAVSCIKTSLIINQAQSEHPIIPVFIIGSEDHDQDEILSVYLFGKNYHWDSRQKGSVGSMIINQDLVDLCLEFTSKFGDSLFANELKDLFLASYKIGSTISRAFASILNTLFRDYGLVVLDINIPEVKKLLYPTFQEEIENSKAKTLTQSTIEFLNSNYKVQANPTEINLFYYSEGDRIKIKKKEEIDLGLCLQNPSLLSPSVILRPLMQQIVIPSIANIGGGAELAYWLELKPIFDYYKVDFPVILLRDIISFLDKKSMTRWEEYGLNLSSFFTRDDIFLSQFVRQDSSIDDNKEKALDEAERLFQKLKLQIGLIDKTLVASVDGEHIKLKKGIDFIYNKAVKALKSKEDIKLQSALKIKHKVFVDDTLTERIQNFSAYYILQGKEWIDHLISISDPFDQKWKIKTLD